MPTLFEVNTLSNSPLVQSGIALGRDPVDAPLWVDGKNVSFRDGEVKKERGWVGLATADEAITEIAQANVGGLRRAYVGGATTLGFYDEGSFIRNIGADYAGGNWLLVPYGSWLLASNGVDPVKVWKNVYTSPAVDLGGTTFSWAKIIFRKNPYVFAMCTSNGRNWIEWCTDDNPEVWTPLSTNTAGNLVCRDLDSDIMAAAELGQQIAVYSKQSMGLITALNDAGGNSFIFGEVQVLRGIGAISKRAVISTGRENYGFSHGGIWWTDGNSYRYLDEQDIRKWIKENVNLDLVDAQGESPIRGYHNFDQNRIEWAVPLIGSSVNNARICMSYGAQGLFDTGSKPFTVLLDNTPSAMSEKSVFDYPLLGFGTMLAQGETGVDANDAALAAFIQSKPLDCGDQELYKRVQQLRLNIRTEGTPKVYLGLQNTLDDVIEWLGPYDAARVIPLPDREAVFISLKVTASALGDDFTLAGFKLLGQPGGIVGP